MSKKHRPPKHVIASDDLVDAYFERELSRRRLLRSALAVAAATATGAAALACERPAGEAAGQTPPADEPPAGRAAGEPAAKKPPEKAAPQETAATAAADIHLVGIGGDDDHVVALDAALAEVGGLDFIGAGDTIYFKVNSNSGDPWPHSTSPALIVALAERCRDHGAERIIVGDRSFWGDRGTRENLRENGIADAAEEAGAELIAFEDDSVAWVQFPEERVPDWRGGFRLPKPVVEADHILNLPCVKTHFIAHFTMSLKNAFGLIHADDRSREGNLRHHDTESGRLWRQIAQVNAVFTPSLNILDGHRALITGGPNAGRGYGAAEATYADPKVVIASRDRIAADVTGIALLQTLSPDSEAVTDAVAWQQPQIAAAVERDLGLADPAHYDLSAPTIDDETLAAWRTLATKS